MLLDKKIIDFYQNQGVVLLKNIISKSWIEILKKGIKKNFEKLQLIPILIITPLVFLGGSFYSINMLPEFWQKVSLFNPVLYLVSGFRWSFYEIADVSIFTSLATMFFILFSCITIISMSFAKGYKIKN